MRSLKLTLIIVFIATVLCGCAITHKFGPYYGKVVDVQTGEPIEGAVVLLGFFTRGGSVGGTLTYLIDAVEAVSDAGGDFRIPSKRITGFKLLQLWDSRCRATVFKPGFGSYPLHKGTYAEPVCNPFWTLYENTHMTVYLPKLLTRNERMENLSKIRTPAGITNDLMPNLLRLKTEERVNVGLKP